MKTLYITPLLSITLIFNALANENDSLTQVELEHLKAKNTEIERQLSDLERSVKLIDSGQLNYKIEKDLLKETYSNNYDKLNVVLVLILTVIGGVGYKFMNDIKELKKSYEEELDKLRTLKSEFDLKSKKFDSESKRFSEELNKIIESNKEQDSQIKVLELKEKLLPLLQDGQASRALEYIDAALKIKKDDADLHSLRGKALCRLGRTNEAVSEFKRAYELSDDGSNLLDYIEMLYLSGATEKADKLLEENPERILNKNQEARELLDVFFKAWKMYHAEDADGIKEIITNLVSVDDLEFARTQPTEWALAEGMYVIYYAEDGDMKTLLQNLIWYLDGQHTGRELLNICGLPIPT